MRQAVTSAVRRVDLGETDAPTAPGSGEALLDIASVGVCGSDIGMWAGTDPYAVFPIRQGHEFSGRIAALGPGYQGPLSAADLVAVEPLIADGTCIACRRGRPNCCVDLKVYGAHIDGAFTEQLLVPVTNLYPAGNLTPDLAAFVEPISIGLQMVTRSGLSSGDQVVIFGAGPIGQAVLLAAVDRGARVASVDIARGRLERALEHGAELAFDALDGGVEDQLVDWTDGSGPVIAFEATGVASVFRQAVDVVAHSGVVVVAGTSTEDFSLASLSLVKKEIDLRGSRNNTGLYGEALELVERSRAQCESLITQRYPLESLQEAMEFGEANPSVVNKMVIQVQTWA